MYGVAMSITRLNLAPFVLAAVFGFAACGDDGTSTTADDASADDATTSVDPGDRSGYDLYPPATVAETTADTDAPETTVAAAVGLAVMLADSDLGQILVDGDGNTLYLFANDPPDTVTCTGGCASTWPPMPAPDDLQVGDGLDDSMFSSVAGEAGPQLSFNGHPLYYYGGDSAAGDTNGQGVGGVWFALDASGNAIT
jgi:predicted lipoprotein with Yx(FWY)xxD motif